MIQCYVLEHAFDTILGAGEIPHLSFFTEMVCQASSQRDYGRAVAIVNTLAYAPFQVSEMQWKRLIEDNAERINEDILKELFDSLCHHELSTEVSVSNLIRVLQSLCGLTKTASNLNCIHQGEETRRDSLSEDYSKKFEVDSDVERLTVSANATRLGTCDDLLVNENAVASNVPGDNIEEFTNLELVSEHKNVGSQWNEMDKHNIIDGFSSDFAHKESVVKRLDINSECNDLGDSDLYHMLDHNFPDTEVGDSHRSNAPSANEILKNWNESRKKDGILFSFQLFDQM